VSRKNEGEILSVYRLRKADNPSPKSTDFRPELVKKAPSEGLRRPCRQSRWDNHMIVPRHGCVESSLQTWAKVEPDSEGLVPRMISAQVAWIFAG
jgi:hypothetical protein